MFLSNDIRNVSVIEIDYIFSIKCEWYMPEQKVKDLMDVGGGCQGTAIRLLKHKVYFFFYAYTMICVQYMLKDGHTTRFVPLTSRP